MYVQIHIMNSNVYALLDTGSVYTIIDSKYVPEIHKRSIVAVNIKLMTANGSSLSVLGKIELPIVIGKMKYNWPFLIVEKLLHIAILGGDFLKENKMTINYQNMTLRGKSKKDVTEIKQFNSPPVFMAMQKEDITISQYGVINAQLVQSNAPCSVSGYFLYVPDITLWKTNDQLPVNFVVSIVDGIFQIAVATNSDVQLFLPASTILGKLVQLRTNVNSIEQQSEDEVEKIIRLLKIDENPHLSEQNKNILKRMVTTYSDVFSTDALNVTPTDLLTAEIHLTPDAPEVIFVKPRRLPLHLVEQTEEEVKKLLDSGVITPSLSPHNSPAVIVKKPNGKIRIAVDYRALNSYTIGYTCPIQSVDEIVHSVGGKMFYCTFDIKSAYHTLPLKEEHQSLTSFSVGSKTYQWTRLATGIKNAPAYYLKFLQGVFQDQLHQICVFFDDLLISDDSFDGIVKKFEIVLERLHMAKVKLAPEKCEIYQKRVKFLGSFISKEGFTMCHDRIRHILSLEFPTTRKGLQRVLGVFNFVRRFIPKFSEVIKPLTILLRGNQEITRIQSTPEAIAAFEGLKQLITSPPVLVNPDKNKTITVMTDGSKVAIACVIGHRETNSKFHPILYDSRTLSERESTWASYKIEFLAVYHFIRKHNYLLHGAKFIVETDLMLLTYKNLLSKGDGTLFLRWAIHLSQYDFNIIHRPGKDNQIADALSRVQSDDLYAYWSKKIKEQSPDTHSKVIATITDEQTCSAVRGDDSTSYTGTEDRPLPAPKFSNPARLIRGQQQDANLKLVLDWLNSEKPKRKDAQMFNQPLKALWNKLDQCTVNVQKILCYKKFLKKSQKYKLLPIVPQALQEESIKLVHRSTLSPHPSEGKTLETLQETAYWPQMKQSVTNFVRNCEECFLFNLKFKRKNRFPMQYFPQASFPLQCVHYDIVGPITDHNNRKSYILVFVDRFSKFLYAEVLNRQQETDVLASFNRFAMSYGIPHSLVSDNAANLHGSRVLQTFFESINMKKVVISPYRPNVNGLCERYNGVIVKCLRKLIAANVQNWKSMLPFVIYGLNSIKSDTTGFTPSYLFLGRNLRTPYQIVNGVQLETAQTPGQHAMSQQRALSEAFRTVQEVAKKKMEQSKRQYDGYGTHIVKFNQKDIVFIHFPQLKTDDKPYAKFRTYYRGPYIVLSKSSEFTLKVCDIKTGKVIMVHHDRTRKVPSQLQQTLNARYDQELKRIMKQHNLQLENLEEIQITGDSPEPGPQPSTTSRRYEDDDEMLLLPCQRSTVVQHTDAEVNGEYNTSLSLGNGHSEERLLSQRMSTPRHQTFSRSSDTLPSRQNDRASSTSPQQVQGGHQAVSRPSSTASGRVSSPQPSHHSIQSQFTPETYLRRSSRSRKPPRRYSP